MPQIYEFTSKESLYTLKKTWQQQRMSAFFRPRVKKVIIHVVIEKTSIK